MEEDTKAIISKQNAARPSSTPKSAESRQHASGDKNKTKNGFIYVLDENNVPISTLTV